MPDVVADRVRRLFRSRAAIGNGLPGRPSGLVAGGPGAVGRVVRIRIAQLQAGAVAVGKLRPRVTVVIPDNVRGVAGGITENDPIAAVPQATGVVTDNVRDGRKDGQERVGVFRYDQEVPGAQQRIGREVEPDRVVEFPTGEVDRAAPPVVQFDPLLVRLGEGFVGRLVVVHDLVDDDLVPEQDHVRGIRRGRIGPQPFAKSVRVSGARAVLHDGRVRNRGAVVVQEKFVLVVGAEAERRLVEKEESAGQNCLGRQRVAAGRDPRRDDAVAGGIDVRRRGVEQLNPEAGVGCARDLVEDQRRGQVRLVDGVGGSRRAADGQAPAPVGGFRRSHVLFDFGEGDTRPIRRGRPVALVVVGELIHDAAIVVAEAQRFTGVGQPPVERTEDAGDAVGELDRGGVDGDDGVAAPGENRVSGEVVRDAPPQPPFGDIHVHGHLVVQFNPLQRRLVRGRMVHDLIEDHDTVADSVHTGCNREQDGTHGQKAETRSLCSHMSTISE